MRIERADLANCAAIEGVAVVIDVIRAFTTAAFAFAAGASEVLPVGSIEEALALRERFPGALAMGETGGWRPERFDFGNSPAALQGRDLGGRRVIQRTGAGTQGLVRSRRASALYAASMVCAGTTAEALRRLDPPVVTLVATALPSDRDGEEDLACADYLEALLRGERPDPAPYLARVRSSSSAALFVDAAHPAFPSADIDLCASVDRFAFAMPVERRDGLLWMRPWPVGEERR